MRLWSFLTGLFLIGSQKWANGPFLTKSRPQALENYPFLQAREAMIATLNATLETKLEIFGHVFDDKKQAVEFSEAIPDETTTIAAGPLAFTLSESDGVLSVSASLPQLAFLPPIKVLSVNALTPGSHAFKVEIDRGNCLYGTIAVA